jgi:hypothetical protein
MPKFVYSNLAPGSRRLYDDPASSSCFVDLVELPYLDERNDSESKIDEVCCISIRLVIGTPGNPGFPALYWRYSDIFLSKSNSPLSTSTIATIIVESFESDATRNFVSASTGTRAFLFAYPY